jgi:Amt family ammonium transporter
MDGEYLINSLWVFIAGIFVFFMQAGFALLEAGLCRAKNCINILMKNVMDFGIGAFAYTIFGFGLMYGASRFGLFGTSNFLNPLAGFDVGIPLSASAFFFFQLVFCAATATIVSGAMAERTQFKSYLIYSFVISLFIYPVSGHWIWGGGWLAQLGFMDFAGSTAVHSVGGWASLMGAILVGPRIGKYTKDKKSNAIPAHNIFMACLGMFILWMGWYGFNPGSELAFNDVVLHTVVTTTLAGALGSLAALVFTWVRYGKPDLSMVLNGILGALVSITAGCKYVDIWGAMIIGLLGGFVVCLSVEFIDRKLKVDDPVGAISVHGVCGAFGTLCIGLFASVNTDVRGLFYGGGFRQLGIQALGVVCVFAWAIATCFILFSIIKKTIGLRVSEEEELKGLDIREHGAEAYPEFLAREQDLG